MSVRSNGRVLPNDSAELQNDGSELPEGWKTTSLSDLLISLESGSRPRGGVRGIVDGVPSIGGEHLNYDGTFNFESIKYVPHAFAAAMKKGRIHYRDILIVKDGATTGKTAFVGADFPHSEAFVNEHVFICRATEKIDAEFLFRFLMCKDGQERILENFKGSAQGGINQAFASNVQIPLAPLAEQRRIVAKLAALLAQVTTAQQRLSRIPALLKRFRQSVLAAACSGRLTADWREANPAMETGKELLTRLDYERRQAWSSLYAKRRYQPPRALPDQELPSIPASWIWTNVDHCASEITVGHVGPMKDRYVEKGVAFLRSQNVRPLRFQPLGMVRIPAEFQSQLAKSQLFGGEILVVRSGANTGDCCVFPRGFPEANCADLVITRPLSCLCAEFAAVYISSPFGQAAIGLRQTGIAQPHFNIGAMRSNPFPLPPLAEQQEIVRRVEQLFALADRIESRLHAAQERVDRLTQSLLAKAVLTSQQSAVAKKGRSKE
jgi:type I restriction enzyme S subunit